MPSVFRPRYNPTRLFACLFAGSATSLLLALAGPILSPDRPPISEYGFLVGGLDFADVYRARMWLATRYTGCFMPSTANPLRECEHAVRSARYVHFDVDFGMESQHVVMPYFDLFDSGWPFRSLSASRLIDDGGYLGLPSSPNLNDKSSGWLGFTVGATSYVIPTHPRFPALLLNAVTWSAITWLAVQMCLQLRAATRIHRRLCPHCAYDLRATPPDSPCPECGAAHLSH